MAASVLRGNGSLFSKDLFFFKIRRSLKESVGSFSAVKLITAWYVFMRG